MLLFWWRGAGTALGSMSLAARDFMLAGSWQKLWLASAPTLLEGQDVIVFAPLRHTAKSPPWSSRKFV